MDTGSLEAGRAGLNAVATQVSLYRLAAPVAVAVLLFQGAVDVAFGVASGDGLAFVILPFAAYESDLDFGEAGVVDIHAQGDDGPIALGGARVQVIDLASVEEQFAGACLLVIGAIAVSILGYVHAHEPGLAVADENEALAQIHGADAHGLDLGACKGDAGFEGLFYEIVVARLAICGDGAGPGRRGLLLLFSQCLF